MKNKFLKKSVVFCAMVLLSGVLSACGPKNGKGTESSGETNSASTAATGEAERPYVKDIDLSQYLTVKDYQDFRVGREDVQVSEDEVNEMVDSVYINSFPEELGVKDREVVIGDTVIIDYEGKKDGVAFEGGTAEKSPLTIGSGNFIDGFEDGLIGVTPGETVDLNLKFPDDYHSEDLAGQEVVFTVTVHYIIPEEKMDEAVQGIIEEVNSVEELRQYVYDYLYEYAAQESTENYEEKVIDAFIDELCEFKEIPQSFLTYYRTTVYNDVLTSALQMGTDANTLIQYYYQMDLDTFLDEYSEIATKRDLAMYYVAIKEGLLIENDDDLKNTLEKVAAEYGYASGDDLLNSNGITLEDFRQDYAYNEALEYIVELASK